MAKKPMTRVEVCEEPEIQYLATPELFAEIRQWLDQRGAVQKKSEQDMAVYYDTKNFRLLREGIEYRIKEKGDKFRHDMKTPVDTKLREVVPDEHGILHRNELKFKSGKVTPRLSNFFGQALLKPVQERVYRFFDKELEPKFRSWFYKDKLDHETDCKQSRVEYSFQKGHMETIGKNRKTETLHILELELREGSIGGLLEEKAALEKEFFPKGLTMLPERKIMIGFNLLEPDMDAKQRHCYMDARIRNSAPSDNDNVGKNAHKLRAA